MLQVISVHSVNLYLSDQVRCHGSSSIVHCTHKGDPIRSGDKSKHTSVCQMALPPGQSDLRDRCQSKSGVITVISPVSVTAQVKWASAGASLLQVLVARGFIVGGRAAERGSVLLRARG